MISAFLDHLETDRHKSARSGNTRLAALRSLFRYAALRHPEHAQLIAQVLAIPQKRYDKTIVAFLEPEEVDALLAAPGPELVGGEQGRPGADGPGRADRPAPLRADGDPLR